MLSLGQQERMAALVREDGRVGWCAIDFDGGGKAIKDGDGAVGGAVAEFDGIGGGGGGFELAVEVEDAEGRWCGGGLDGDGPWRQPEDFRAGDGPETAVDFGGAGPGDAGAEFGIEDEAAGDVVDFIDAGGGGGEEGEVDFADGVFEVEGNAGEGAGGELDELEEFDAGLLLGGVDVLVAFDDVDVDGEFVLMGSQVLRRDLGIALGAEVPDGGGVFDEKGEVVAGELGEEAIGLGADGVADAGVELVVDVGED